MRYEKNAPESAENHIRMARQYATTVAALEDARQNLRSPLSLTEAATLATMHATCALMEAELLKDYSRD